MADPVAVILEQEEDRVPTVYKDHLGNDTIGIGFLVDKKRGGGLQDIEIDFILNNRIAQIRDYLDKYYPWMKQQLTKPRYDAMVLMCYQLGVGTFDTFKGTLAAMKSGDYAAAYKNIRESLWGRQTPERARRVADQIKLNTYIYKYPPK